METAIAYWEVYIGNSTMPEAIFLKQEYARNWMNTMYGVTVEKKIFKKYRAHQDMTKRADESQAKICDAANLLRDLLDGGEEYKGMDAAISDIIRVLEA
jgi:hypothetical protein